MGCLFFGPAITTNQFPPTKKASLSECLSIDLETILLAQQIVNTNVETIVTVADAW
jgi:hypothetical protein